jgi:hypothetical protein
VPAEVVVALVARDVIAATVFLYVYTASWTGLRAHSLDLFETLLIFSLRCSIAASGGVPRPAAGNT